MFARFVRMVWQQDGEPHSFIQRKKTKHAANRGNGEKVQSEVPKALFLPYKKKQIQTGLN